MSDFKVVLPRTTEEWQRDMNIAYQQGRADVIDDCIALARAEIDFESQAEQKRFVEFMEQLKKQK